MAGQLVFPFRVEPALKAADFILAPCNEQAVAFVQRWPDWPARAGALFGPTGCGKSHLAEIWRQKADAHRQAAGDLTSDRMSVLQAHAEAAFLIEDVDRDEPTAERDLFLLSLFERANGALLMTGRAPPSEWPVAVGDLKSRFQSLLAFPMWMPDDALLSALVAKHFSDRQVDVPESAIRKIVTHVERTPEAIAAFVSRADGKAFAEKRAITDRLVLELIASETPPLREGG